MTATPATPELPGAVAPRPAGTAAPSGDARRRPSRRRPGSRWRWVRRALLAAVLLPVLVVVATAVRVDLVGRSDARPPSDVILVLGAAQYDGTPSDALAARLEHARRLLVAGVAPRILTVGGRRAGDRFSEAGAGQAWLIQHGVDPLRILPVEQGSDTLLSVRAAAAVMRQRGWRSVVVVTDPWHELRARRMASDQGLQAAASPVTTGPSVGSTSVEIRYVARETAAYLYYRLFHRASRAGPAPY